MKKKILYGFLTIISLFLIYKVMSPSYSYTVGDLEITVNKDELSEARQSNWDKMKIEYVKIKSRITGTAPFNSGDSSNANGVDVSPSDDYIRTFDVIKYTVELGAIPNTAVEGVDDNSSFHGGVIKVVAELPNQGTPTLMRWETDAWMQNIKFSNDNTILYAEYFVPSGVVLTNANQNLSFTIKVDGYKKNVTSDMAPKFTIWMEGNNPDNEDSTAEAVVAADTERSLIISGHSTLDINQVIGGYINFGQEKEINGNNIYGQYVNNAMGISIVQDVSGFPDLRGIELPYGPITIQMKMEYLYNVYGTTDWHKLSTSEYNIPDNINGTRLIAYSKNGFSNENYYPVGNALAYTLQGIPYGGGTGDRTVVDTGDVTIVQNGDNFTMTIQNYKVNGKFPNWTTNEESPTIPDTIGYFGVVAMEWFVPHYDYGNNSYNYQLNLIPTSVNYKSIDGTNHQIQSENNTLQDNSPGNTNAAFGIISYLTGNMWAPTRIHNTSFSQVLSSPYWLGNSNSIVGGEIGLLLNLYFSDGPYLGGAARTIIWNTDIFKYKIYDNSDNIRYFDVYTSNNNGLPLPSAENVKGYFGIYKSNPSQGTNTNSLTKAATYDDFDWYENYQEAITHGVISAMYFDDPDFRGITCDRAIYLRFDLTDDVNKVGETGVFRYIPYGYGDAERTQVYGGSGPYAETTYNMDGSVASHHNAYTYGNTLLLLGVKARVTTTVSDLDYRGFPKTSYDVQDERINVKIKPLLTNEQLSEGQKTIIPSVTVKAVLPVGLSYIPGSANKTPKLINYNADGTTTITWEYLDWQVNESAPTYPEITYSAEISAALENNSSVEIKSAIFTTTDLSDEENFRTSKYGVVISNLSGSRVSKTIDKPALEENESFQVESIQGNNSEDETLLNVKSIEILPRNNDGNGSSFHGSYQIRVVSLDLSNNERMFYTTNDINNIGLTYDREGPEGKNTIKNVDLPNDSRWHEVQVGDIIPANATAIATVTPSIPAQSEVRHVLEIMPSNNQKADTYSFNMNMTSNNLTFAVKSNTVVTKVIERKISGVVFVDKNDDKLNTPVDARLNNFNVYLLNSSGQQIGQTHTDANGYYELSLPGRGYYYVKFENRDGYELISKGTAINASKANSTYITDLIDQTAETTLQVYMIDNINAGYKPLITTLTVYHYKKGTEEAIPGCAMEQTDEYMGQPYEANTCGSLGDYEFKGEYTIAAGTGTYDSTNQKVTGTHTISKTAGGTVVKFYYELKKYKLTVQHLKLGRNNSTGEFIKTSTKVYEPDYEENNITVGTSYNASPQIKDTNSLMTPYTGKFQYEETDEVISGTIRGDTVVKLFYKPSTTTVIVRYIDKDTNQRVNSENVDYTYNSDVYYDDVFLMTPTSHKIANNTVTPTVNIPSKYKFHHVEVTGATETTISDGSVIGRVDGNPTTITFYYEKQTAILNVYHYKLRRNNDGTYSKTEEQAPGTTHELNQAIEIDSNHNVLPSSSISDGYYFQFAEYTNPNNVTTTLTNAYYELSGIEANKVYTFKYYYAEPLAKVTTRYLNCDTGVMVADSVEEEIPYTGGYSGAKEENLAGYNYKGDRYTLYPQDPDRGDPESSDTVTKSEYRVDYCYKKQYKLEVKYVNSITNELIETPATITDQEDGDHYTTVKKEFANYVYTSMEGTDDGYINANTVDANGIVHVVYKYLPTYSLTVKHVRCSDSYELHEPSVENDIAHGTQYTVSHIDIAGYHHVSPESPRQVTIESDTTVEFCYAPNDYPVTENYIDCDSKESIHQSHTDNYTYLSTQNFDKIDIENYTFGRVETNIENPVYSTEIEGRVTVTIPIVEENNPATVTYCYNKKKATLIVHHENCATTPHTTVAPDDPELEVEWGDRYSTSAKVIENYVNTSDSGNTSGPVDETTVVNNRIVVTYCYGKQAGSLTVKYLEDGSDAVIIPAHEETPLEYGTSYNARNYKENIPNWEYVRVAGNEEGTISGNVTVTYYYRRTIGNLTVHYVDSITREEIATSENRQWPLGEDYSTIPYIKVISNYTFTNSHEGAETGAMGDPTSDVHVTYLYTKAGVQLVVRYIDMDTGEEFPNSGVTNNSLHYGDHYDTEQKEFPYYRFVRVDKPTSGYIYNQLVITYSYRRNTGIVRAYYRDIETQQEIAVREDQEIPYEGHYDTVQKEIAKYNFERSDGVTSGTLLTDEVEVTYFYRKQRGKVITRHFDRTNNTQFGNDIVQEYKLDDRYVTSSIEIDNYELVATPDNYVGIVTSTTPIIVNYYYDQLKGVVITRYLDEDTKEELLPTSRIGYNYGDRYSTIKRTIDNYTWSRTDGIENGTVGENQIVVTYYYKINIGRLTVEHLESGTNRNLAEPIVHDYPYGTSYETRREIFENYEFVNVSGVESGKIYGNVVVRYYYKLKDATITVNYLDERDHAVHLKDTEVYNVKWGDNYLFNSVRIENFDYVREDGDPERGVVDGSKVINYYYNRRQANLVVHHLESGTERILANEDREIVYYGLNYTTNSKTIPGYKMDASLRPDNAYGIVDGDIDVTYYYDRKEAEVITTYIDRATGSPLLPPDIVGYNYGDTYTTIEREIDNYELVDIDGAPTGKVRKDVTEVIYYYERRVGNITIKYLDETDLTELSPTIHKEINYGEDYTSDEKQFAGYELSRIDGTPSGKVDGDKIVIYYYKKKAATLIVQYLELVTNEALHAETVTPHKYGDTYQTVKLDITNYDFVMVDGDTNGTIDRDIVTVIYYYERRKANIIARYIEEGTNKEVAPPQTQEVGLGKYYVTTSSGAVPPNYELVRKTDNYEGIARQDEIEVFYYYRKVDSDLVTKITKVGIEEISSKDDFVDYEINYEARLNDYIGTATVTITDKLPYQIDIERSSLDGGTYNPYKNTIEWVIPFDDDDLNDEYGSIDTYSGDDTIMITKYVSLKYVGIDATERTMVNTVEGKIKLSNNQKEVSDNLITRISIPGTIIVHHYLKGTNEELVPDEYNEGLVGETYISSPQELEGYRVVTRPTNETHTFGENLQEVVYEYERIKFNLDVEVIGGIGDITGTEEIFYGDDSTPGNIVITPGEGYEIEKIIINGVSYEVDNHEGMTLDNFINVQENIKVEVEFTEKPLPVPITGSESKLIVVALILIILTIMFVAYKVGFISKLLKR